MLPICQRNAEKRYITAILSLGTLIEWAEYTFYGYMAITLSSLFFPESSPGIGILKTYGIFAIGYILRPVGAIFFGHIGDSFGRKPALMGSLFLMGAATFGIGCLPTYATIGALAPLLLLILRMFQGIAVSGEYNGAAIFLIEKTGSKHPTLAGSWIGAAAAGGMVLGGLAAFCTTLPAAPVWAWRIPFMLGGLACLIGMVLRRTVSESPLLLEKIKRTEIPFIAIWKNHKKSLLITASIAAFTGVFVYIGNIYMMAFLKQEAGLSTHLASFFAIFGEVIVMVLIPLMAVVADLTNPYRQYLLGLALVAIGAPLIFILSATGYYPFIFVAMILYGITNGIVCAPMMKILYDLFPPEIRYTGISFAYSVSVAIFGGSAPMVAQYLSLTYQAPLIPSLYVSVIALITFFICFIFREENLCVPLKSSA